MILLIFILLIVLFAYACFGLWPNRSLWFLLEYSNKQRYRIHLDGADYRLDNPMTVIAQMPSLKMACLLRRLTHLPIYWVTDHAVSSSLKRFFLKKTDIHLVKSFADIPSARPGLTLVSSYDENLVHQESGVPIWTAYLCGVSADSHTKMRWIHRDLQLSVRRYHAHKEGDLHVALQRLSVYAWERYVDKLPSIIESWLEQSKALGARLAVADSTGAKLTHHRLITAVLTLRSRFFTMLAADTRVGVCLPSSAGGITVLLTLLSLGKTVVNLNYTASIASLQAAIQEAGIHHIITSRRFLDQLAKKGFEIEGVFEGVELIFLEEVRKTIQQKELLKNFLIAKFSPVSLLKMMLVNPIGSNQVATILFSSGSEGKPKGIELTHRNIVGNARQAADALEARADDVIFSILPTFHAFGLTATTLLPLIEGITTICHPDPTDTATIGELAKQYKVSILCGTSTFFRLYAKARNLPAEAFRTLRIVVAGAERLAPEVRVLFEEKFKKTIYEGYGTTELSPVAHVNRPDTAHEIRQKMGTVGTSIAGSMVRILDPETDEELPIGESGMVVIGGVNVMKGYLDQPEKTNAVLLYHHGIRWYKTGDKGRLDHQGFLTILDRYSRFAKLGGEMISLGAIEQQINLTLNHEEVEILAVAVPDLKKGEKVVLLHAGPLSSDEMETVVRESALPNLMRPAEYQHVEAIPKLGSGKTDFAKAKRDFLRRKTHRIW
ncbi:MAG: AMP-binding protein [Gammaproteobacteria bacterium]|nr:AMP-binding protein [Gammaproteobacteria bacterium]